MNFPTTPTDRASAGTTRTGRLLRGVMAAAALAVGMVTSGALAEPPPDAGAYGDKPAALNGVGIDQKLNSQLPLDLAFTDQSGKAVKLGDYFKPGRPVLLTMVYFECPMLCTYVLNGEKDALKQINLVPGKDYMAVTVSFNPDDKPEMAAKKRANYLKSLGKPEAENGWVFLTGTKANILKLADAAGFRYHWVPQAREYAHASVLMVATPGGRMSRYMEGVVYDPKTLKLSMEEASGGKIGSFVDQVVLYCYLYDPTKGAYVPIPMRIMQLGGALTVLVLGTTIGGFLLHDHRNKKKLNHVEETHAA